MSLSIAQSQKKLLALQREGENRLCFECKAVNPQWASPKYGIFICLECAGTHRSLGVHISFVRSVTMDQFKPEELKLMEIGGNEKARLFFEDNGIDSTVSIKDKYNSTVAEDYREKLAAEAKGETWTRRDRPVHIPKTAEPETSADESTAATLQFQKSSAAAQAPEPSLNDLATDALGAITSGWGWFSQTVSQSVSETTENYIRPGMRQFADSDLGGNARKAMAQFGKRAKEAGVYGAEQLNLAIENFGLEEEQQRPDSEFADLFDGWKPRDRSGTDNAATGAAEAAGNGADTADSSVTHEGAPESVEKPTTKATSETAASSADPPGNKSEEPSGEVPPAPSKAAKRSDSTKSSPEPKPSSSKKND